MPDTRNNSSVETKLLNILAKNKKQKGDLDNGDQLLFNTYYNTLVGNQEVDLNRLLGKEMLRFSTPSTSSTRNKHKYKKVQWADEDAKANTRRNNSTETNSLHSLSKLIYGDIRKYKLKVFKYKLLERPKC